MKANNPITSYRGDLEAIYTIYIDDTSLRLSSIFYS
nr:MAG TPA: hypothetical protein [Bacteriophage sp.]